MSASSTVAVVGLGYVGLPLAVAFGRQRPTVGLDLSREKVAAYREGRDGWLIDAKSKFDSAAVQQQGLKLWRL